MFSHDSSQDQAVSITQEKASFDAKGAWLDLVSI